MDIHLFIFYLLIGSPFAIILTIKDYKKLKKTCDTEKNKFLIITLVLTYLMTIAFYWPLFFVLRAILQLITYTKWSGNSVDIREKSW